MHKGWKGTKQETNPGSVSAGYAKQICPKCGAKRIDKQLGLEPTFEEYIDKLCTIYDEVKRVLRKDGTCWVNLGDTYNAGRTGGWAGGKHGMSKPENSPNQSGVNAKNLPTKSLCLIPQRFAIEMVNRGWILRNVIIWHKPNPMPSSAKDRFTVDFEYVYFFVKSKKYWFEPQYEPYVLPLDRWGGIYTDGNVPGSKYLKEDIDPAQLTQRPRSMRPNALGRNMRTVWTIPTQPFPEAHFATFPEKLVEPMIKAGCPEFVCTKCGTAREKILKDVGEKTWTDERKGKSAGSINVGTRGLSYGRTTQIEFKGYTDCGCNADWRSGVVLDPFGGACTTALVAYKNKRDYIIVELKPEYIEMGKKRLSKEKEKYGLLENSFKEQKIGQIPLFPVDNAKK